MFCCCPALSLAMPCLFQLSTSIIQQGTATSHLITSVLFACCSSYAQCSYCCIDSLDSILTESAGLSKHDQVGRRTIERTCCTILSPVAVLHTYAPEIAQPGAYTTTTQPSCVLQAPLATIEQRVVTVLPTVSIHEPTTMCL